jgi:hypothetical protein
VRADGGTTDGVSGTLFSATVSNVEVTPLTPRAGVFRPERSIRLSSFSAKDFPTFMERSGTDADSLFCDELGAAISLSCFRIGCVEFRGAIDGGGEVNLGETGHLGAGSTDFGLRISGVLLSMPGDCGGGLFADNAL